jgi:hypothetical protein
MTMKSQLSPSPELPSLSAVFVCVAADAFVRPVCVGTAASAVRACRRRGFLNSRRFSASTVVVFRCCNAFSAAVNALLTPRLQPLGWIFHCKKEFPVTARAGAAQAQEYREP